MNSRETQAERIRLMFDNTPLACMFWIDNQPVDCNQEALKLFGVTEKDELLSRFADFSPPLQTDGGLSQAMHQHYYMEAMEKGRVDTEWLHRDTTGAWIPCFVTLVRVDTSDGPAVVSYTKDLRGIQAAEDRRRRLDERNRELEVQTRSARSAAEARCRFLSFISHEFRTPMNAIIGMSGLIRTESLDEEQRGYFEDIKKMSRTLLQLMNDILDISRIEAGRMELHPVHFNLLELFDNVCSLWKFQAEGHGLRFRSNFEPDVPHIVYGDDMRLHQILGNLIGNAVKYTREGSVDFTVSLLTRGEREFVAFAVKDTGIGIKREDYARLFHSFEQLDGVKNRGIPGTGLGLAITKHLLTMMDGDVEVESEYGRGSTFTALVPLAEGDPALVEKSRAPAGTVIGGGARVLVADDNPVNLRVAQAFLAVHGIAVETAASGEEALEKAKQNCYDLIFMDQMMPGMSGTETAAEIRAAERKAGRKPVPIIALTANAAPGARDEFIAAGMNDFICKPLDAAELNVKLAAWLGEDKQAEEPEPKERRIAAWTAGGVVDREEGLRQSRGDVSLYREVCESFLRSHRNDAMLLADAVEKGDTRLCRRLAHTLKSSAALIGAGALRDAARTMEDELSGRALGPLQEELAKALDDLGRITADIGAAGGEKPALAGASAEQLREVMETVLPFLRTGNTRCLEYLDKIKGLVVPLDGRGEILIQQIDGFDFTAARTTAESIRKDWENDE